MSYADRMIVPMRQKVLAALAILLMLPVILDALKFVHLGEYRLVPFLLLLLASGLTMVPRSKETANG